MRKHWKKGRSVLASVVAVAMVGSLSFAPALASARQGEQDLATGSIAAGVPEWAIDDGNAQADGMSAQAELPATYDLRSEGLVTPVKFQNPWGSCWAFGGTSAAEISLLTASGKKYGPETDSEHAVLDLSERHLTYFALQPVTESVNPSQVGEGLHTYQPTQQQIDVNPYAVDDAAFNAGGLPVFITTLFAQGVGPVAEEVYPYRGSSGMSTAEDYEANPTHLATDTKEQLTTLAEQYHMTFDQFIQAQAAALNMTVDEAFAYFEQQIKTASDEKTGTGSYTKYDDWSIPAVDEQGHPNRLLSGGFVLKNGNVLPDYWSADADYTQLNQDSVNAIKQEVLNGRGVNIAFYADQSPTYTMSDDDGAGHSVNNRYNQYVNEPKKINHGVCIVGWDDSYAAENFRITPPGNGAWIVKNSWGSTKDAVADDLGHVMGKMKYGIKDENGEYTGCFYLSYYDQTIKQSETMEFSANLGSEGRFAAMQHDYLPANNGFYKTPATSDVMSSANVFSTDDTAVVVKSVSTRTAEANMRVTFAIYELKDNATDPTDGTLLYRTSQNFEYGGYHRLDLDRPITFDKNKKFSIVSTASVVGVDGVRVYSASAAKTVSKEACDYARAQNYKVMSYGEAVVNKGESYLYSDGEWQDWTDYLEALPADDEAKGDLPAAERYTQAFPVDNFSIKAYVEPAPEEPIVKTDISDATVTVAKATYNSGKAVTPKVMVKLDGKTLKSGTDYTVSYVNNKNAGTGVATVKGQGDYTGSAAKAFEINKAANTMKASGKTATVKASKLAKANQVITKPKAFSITKAKGDVTFKKSSGNKKITVSKAGKLTVKKGLAKGTYKVKVKVTAAGNENYKKVTKTVTVTVKVK